MSQINLSYKLVKINSIGGQKVIWLTWSADIGAEGIYSAVDIVPVASLVWDGDGFFHFPAQTAYNETIVHIFVPL